MSLRFQLYFEGLMRGGASKSMLKVLELPKEVLLSENGSKVDTHDFSQDETKGFTTRIVIAAPMWHFGLDLQVLNHTHA